MRHPGAPRDDDFTPPGVERALAFVRTLRIATWIGGVVMAVAIVLLVANYPDCDGDSMDVAEYLNCLDDQNNTVTLAASGTVAGVFFLLFMSAIAWIIELLAWIAAESALSNKPRSPPR